MTDFVKWKAISRRSLIQGAGASSLVPFISRARAADAVDQAVNWAKANLPHSTPDIVRGAAKEGKLNLTLYNLGGGEEAVRAAVAGFRKRYPFIDVDFNRQDTTQLVIKFNGEVNSRRGISDYVNLPSNILTSTAFIKQGAIAKFVVSQDAAFPPGSKNSGYWYAWRSERATTVYRIGALTDEEKKLVRTYQGLADPRFKGRLGITSVNNTTCAVTAYMLMYGPKPQLWTGLARNKPVVKPSSQALVSSILAGEVDIGVLSGSSSPLVAARDGAPVAYGSTSPSTSLYTPGGISALAPHPNAARLWQDWFTSIEGQRIWVVATGNQPVRTGVGEKGWSEKQPWFFDDHIQHAQFDWEGFSKKQKDVIARFAKDIQS